jgi:hypothetical protein
MSTPVRYPSGVSTANKNTTLWNFPAPDFSKYITYWDDFFQYVAGDWTLTETQAAATQALGDITGGALVLTNSSADDDLNSVQRIGEAFMPVAGKQFFMKARFKLNEVVQSDAMIGIVVTDTSPFASPPTDGIFFLKTDGAATLDVVCRKDTTTGNISATAVGTMVADTFITVGVYFDGVRYMQYFVNDVQVGSLDLTTSPSAFLPDTECRVTLAVQQGEITNVKTLTVDYILVAQER